jgi:predicted phosphoribosyltransferase
MIFQNRQEAGQELIPELWQFSGNQDVVILGLPRGGVVVAYEIAKALKISLDIIVPRKIGSPDNPEFAIGAITEDGEGIFNRDIIDMYRVPWEYIEKEVAKQAKEATRRLKVYRGDRPPIELKGKTVIIVDDGIATGSTMLAAIKSIKSREAEKIIVAVPVASMESISKVKSIVDKVICLQPHLRFGAVGACYEDFRQVQDDEVIEIMHKSEKHYH